MWAKTSDVQTNKRQRFVKRNGTNGAVSSVAKSDFVHFIQIYTGAFRSHTRYIADGLWSHGWSLLVPAHSTKLQAHWLYLAGGEMSSN